MKWVSGQYRPLVVLGKVIVQENEENKKTFLTDFGRGYLFYTAHKVASLFDVRIQFNRKRTKIKRYPSPVLREILSLVHSWTRQGASSFRFLSPELRETQ